MSSVSNNGSNMSKVSKVGKALFCQDFVKSNSRADFLDDEDAVVDYDGDDEICTEAQKNKPYFWEMSR